MCTNVPLFQNEYLPIILNVLHLNYSRFLFSLHYVLQEPITFTSKKQRTLLLPQEVQKGKSDKAPEALLVFLPCKKCNCDI